MKKLAFIFLASLLLGGCNRLAVHQPLTSTRLSYAKVDAIGQSFISNYNNLNIVSICIRNPNRVLTPFDFNLYESTTSGQPIRTIAFSGGNIDNQDCTRFQFDPIADSAAKKYYAFIVAKPNTQEREYHNVYIEAHSGEDYAKGEAYSGESVTDLDLHFKTFYKQPLKEVLRESLAQLLVRLIKDPFFFIFYLLAILYLTLRLLRK